MARIVSRVARDFGAAADEALAALTLAETGNQTWSAASTGPSS
ncbi:hypothetical protein [Lentzea flava]|nr:hypothetical protein [Lentzea flava]